MLTAILTLVGLVGSLAVLILLASSIIVGLKYADALRETINGQRTHALALSEVLAAADNLPVDLRFGFLRAAVLAIQVELTQDSINGIDLNASKGERAVIKNFERELEFRLSLLNRKIEDILTEAGRRQSLKDLEEEVSGIVPVETPIETVDALKKQSVARDLN